jgi:hypothetical protein
MPKRLIIFGGIVAISLAAGIVIGSFGRGKVLVQADQRDKYGELYTVRVKRVGNNFRTELLYRGKIPVSSYGFYEGSVPATNAVIEWPKLGDFRVKFDNGNTVSCVWDDHKTSWDYK